MSIPQDIRGWFERAIYDLALAQANLRSARWDEGARQARQAAIKFFQAAIVKDGDGPEPSPRMADLVKALRRHHASFEENPAWANFDRIAGAESIDENEAREAYRNAESIRDAVSHLLG